MKLGEYLRECREAIPLTLTALAKRLDLSVQYLCDVEHDRREPSPRQLADWARVVEANFDVAANLAGRCKRCNQLLDLWTASERYR